VADYRITEQAPAGWVSCCDRSNALFGSADWQRLLESSFGCRTLYAWDGETGGAVTVFRAGPFAVGYLGFPAGGFADDHHTIAAIVSQLETAGAARGLTCLRVPLRTSDARYELPYRYVVNPETVIGDLQNWDPMGVSKNLRRDLRKAERSELCVRLVQDRALGSKIYGMYRDSVKHHRGSLRYTSAYFAALLELAGHRPAVQIFIAELASKIVGFAAIARHGDTAFYLHGGAVADARKLSPSDLILKRAIVAAQQAGCNAFSFMASPADQPNLVRYKEKWGGETRPLATYTVPLSSAYPLFRAAESLHRLLS